MAPPDKPFGAWGARLYDGLGLLGGAILAVMALAVFVQVALRYVGRAAFDGLGLLGGAVLAAMALAVFLQVLLRYVFTYALDGLDEVPRYLFVWLVMIGAAAAMHRGEHTALDYFRQRLAPRGRALAVIVTNGVGMLLFLVHPGRPQRAPRPHDPDHHHGRHPRQIGRAHV